MSLFTYLLRIFFFSLRERMYSWRCVTHSRRAKQAQLRAHLLSPGRSHVQRQGRDGCVGGSGTCVLPADAASFGSEPPSCRWELGSVSGPSKWPSRWFWGDRTACVVMGSLKRLMSTNRSTGCGLPSRRNPGRQTRRPRDAQSSPAETPPRPIEATPSKNGHARTRPFLFTSSGQAIPLRKPALASVGAVLCRQIGSPCVLICHSGLKGGLSLFIFMSNVKPFPSAFYFVQNWKNVRVWLTTVCFTFTRGMGLWHFWQAGVNLPELSLGGQPLRGYPTHLGSWALNLMEPNQPMQVVFLHSNWLPKKKKHHMKLVPNISFSQFSWVSWVIANTTVLTVCVQTLLVAGELAVLPKPAPLSKIQAGELSAGRKDLNPACKWLLAN